VCAIYVIPKKRRWPEMDWEDLKRRLLEIRGRLKKMLIYNGIKEQKGKVLELMKEIKRNSPKMVEEHRFEIKDGKLYLITEFREIENDKKS